MVRQALCVQRELAHFGCVPSSHGLGGGGRVTRALVHGVTILWEGARHLHAVSSFVGSTRMKTCSLHGASILEVGRVLSYSEAAM